MMFKRTLHSSLRTIVLLTALSGRATGVLGQSNDGPKILFLHLKLQPDNTVKLMNSITRPGELKPAANMEFTDGINYELLDAAGMSLWHAAITDPSQRTFEHADLTKATKLKLARVELPQAEFMVRVPVRTNAVQVHFFRLTTATTNSPSKKLTLGIFPLSRE